MNSLTTIPQSIALTITPQGHPLVEIVSSLKRNDETKYTKEIFFLISKCINIHLKINLKKKKKTQIYKYNFLNEKKKLIFENYIWLDCHVYIQCIADNSASSERIYELLPEKIESSNLLSKSHRNCLHLLHVEAVRNGMNQFLFPALSSKTKDPESKGFDPRKDS